NAIAKVTSNLRQEGKQISYDYDFTRLASTSYPDNPGNNVTYSYGAPGAPNSTAGRVTLVTRAAGTVTREDDPIGKISTEAKSIPFHARTRATVPTRRIPTRRRTSTTPGAASRT